MKRIVLATNLNNKVVFLHKSDIGNFSWVKNKEDAVDLQTINKREQSLLNALTQPVVNECPWGVFEIEVGK